MDLFNPPFVSVPASEARARREQYSGRFNNRQNFIMSMLLSSRQTGCTWKAISDFTNEHHGQVSGMLSSMHRNGWVFSLRKIHDGCHPYVHYAFREMFADDEVFDEPTQTKAGINRRALEDFAEQVKFAVIECTSQKEQKVYHNRMFVRQVEDFVIELQSKLE